MPRPLWVFAFLYIALQSVYTLRTASRRRSEFSSSDSARMHSTPTFVWAANPLQRWVRSALGLLPKEEMLSFLSKCYDAGGLPSLLKGHMLVANVECSASDEKAPESF